MTSLPCAVARPGRRRFGAVAGTIAASVTIAAFGSPASASVPPTGPVSDGTTAGSAPADIDRSDWPDTLTIGAVPSEESTSLEASFGQVTQLLEEGLGIDVKFFQATDYAGIIEAQIAGSVDLAQYGPFSYIIAVANGAQIAPVGAEVSGPDAQPGYQSYGITRGDNADVNGLADFTGKTVCFVDPGSTSGYLYPTAGLLDAGIDPETDITPVFAGGHDASVLSVVDGTCDAGFAYDTMVDSQLIDSGDIQAGDVKVVWKSDLIAGAPIAVRTELPQSLQDEITRIILEQANVSWLADEGRCVAPDPTATTEPGATAADASAPVCAMPDGVWGWLPVDDTFYDGVRTVCETTHAEACVGT